MGRLRSIRSFLPVVNFENGIIKRKDGSFCKIVEIYPINFLLKSEVEQEVILHQYKTFLKACDFDIQILIKSEEENLEEHIATIIKNREKESSETLIKLMNGYVKTIREQSKRNTIKRRFFIVFVSNDKRQPADELNSRTMKIKSTLEKCGVTIKELTKKDEFFSLIFKQENDGKEGISILLEKQGGKNNAGN